jgi:hypothetical protein
MWNAGLGESVRLTHVYTRLGPAGRHGFEESAQGMTLSTRTGTLLPEDVVEIFVARAIADGVFVQSVE